MNRNYIPSIKLLMFLTIIFSIAQPQITSLEVTTMNHTYFDSMPSVITQNANSMPKWLACSLACAKIGSLKDKTFKKINGVCRRAIEDSIIKNHIILVISHALFGQTCIIKADSNVTILSLDYENGFNKMMMAENLMINNFDMAEKVARLFIRMIFPIISRGQLYFMDELIYSTFSDFIKNNRRSEIIIFKNEPSVTYLMKIDYECAKNKFSENLANEKWFTKISKKEEIYTVNILTAGKIWGDDWHERTCCDRVLDWGVTVYPDGTITTKLPKGIKIYTISD